MQEAPSKVVCVSPVNEPESADSADAATVHDVPTAELHDVPAASPRPTYYCAPEEGSSSSASSSGEDTDDDVCDPDYYPSDDSDTGDESTYHDPVQDRKFMVFEQNLDELLVRCRKCGEVSFMSREQIL